MAEMETNNEQSLVKPEVFNGEDKMENDYFNDFKTQAQDYGQKFQDAAVKAKDYATEKFGQASNKLKDLQGKDPQQLAGHVSAAMTDRYIRLREVPVVDGPAFNRKPKKTA